MLFRSQIGAAHGPGPPGIESPVPNQSASPTMIVNGVACAVPAFNASIRAARVSARFISFTVHLATSGPPPQEANAGPDDAIAGFAVFRPVFDEFEGKLKVESCRIGHKSTGQGNTVFFEADFV